MLNFIKKKLFQFQSFLKTSQNLDQIKGIPNSKNYMNGASKNVKRNEISAIVKNRVLRKSHLIINLLKNITLRKEMLLFTIKRLIKKCCYIKKNKNIYGRREAVNFTLPGLLCSSTRTSTRLVSSTNIYIPTRYYPGKVLKIPGLTSSGTSVPPINKEGISLTSSQAIKALSNKSSQPYTPPHFPLEAADNNSSVLKKIFPQQLVRNPTKQQGFTQETLHVRQNKEAILTQINALKKLSDPQHIFDQKDILNMVKDLSRENFDSIFSRQGQVTLEELFVKLRVSEDDVRQVFSQNQLIDLLGQNKGAADITTIYNMAALNNILHTTENFKNLDVRLVVSTPLSNKKFQDLSLSEEVLNFIQLSKVKTGNLIADVSLNGIPFDFKPEGAINKNFICFRRYEDFYFTKKIEIYQYNLHNFYKDLEDPTPFQQEYYKLIVNLLQEKQLNSFQRQQILNEFIFKNINAMDSMQDRASIIMPLSNTPFKPNPLYTEEASSMIIPTAKTIDNIATRKAIIQHILTWPDVQQEGFHTITQEAFKKQIDKFETT